MPNTQLDLMLLFIYFISECLFVFVEWNQKINKKGTDTSTAEIYL